MNVMHLFPIPVAEFHLGRSFTASEVQFVLHEQKRKPNLLNATSVNNYLLNTPEMLSLRKFVDGCVEQYAREVWLVQPDCRLELTQSWANYTLPGAAHHKHSHPNSLFSGVLYLQADDDRDRIHFIRYEPSTLRPAYMQANVINAESWWLPANAGALLMFPSTLLHSVETFGGVLERCSIAFNVFPRGVLGNAQELTEALI